MYSQSLVWLSLARLTLNKKNKTYYTVETLEEVQYFLSRVHTYGKPHTKTTVL